MLGAWPGVCSARTSSDLAQLQPSSNGSCSYRGARCSVDVDRRAGRGDEASVAGDVIGMVVRLEHVPDRHAPIARSSRYSSISKRGSTTADALVPIADQYDAQPRSSWVICLNSTLASRGRRLRLFRRRGRSGDERSHPARDQAGSSTRRTPCSRGRSRGPTPCRGHDQRAEQRVGGPGVARGSASTAALPTPPRRSRASALPPRDRTRRERQPRRDHPRRELPQRAEGGPRRHPRQEAVAITAVSQGCSRTIVTALRRTTPPATTRAETSLTGSGTRTAARRAMPHGVGRASVRRCCAWVRGWGAREPREHAGAGVVLD